MVVKLVAAIVGVVRGEGDSDTAVAPVSNRGDLVTTVGDGEGAIPLGTFLTVWTQSRS